MYKADLNKAPIWATHYMERKNTHPDAFWFVNMNDGRWTAVGTYIEFPYKNLPRIKSLIEENCLVLELNFSLENK